MIFTRRFGALRARRVFTETPEQNSKTDHQEDVRVLDDESRDRNESAA